MLWIQSNEFPLARIIRGHSDSRWGPYHNCLTSRSTPELQVVILAVEVGISSTPFLIGHWPQYQISIRSCVMNQEMRELCTDTDEKNYTKPGLVLAATISLLLHVSLQIVHYNCVMMATMASQSPISRLFAQLFVQVQFKENIKAPRHWPLWGEVTGDRWIPRTKGQ